MHAAIPVVEFADDGDALGVGRPDTKTGAGHVLARLDAGAEQTIGLIIPAFAEKIQVVRRRRRRESVGIVTAQRGAPRLDKQSIRVGRQCGSAPLENARRVPADKSLLSAWDFQCDGGGAGSEHTNTPAVCVAGRAKAGKGIMLPREQQTSPWFGGRTVGNGQFGSHSRI